MLLWHHQLSMTDPLRESLVHKLRFIERSYLINITHLHEQ